MEDITNALLPTEFLVVDPAPGWRRVECTPTEIRAAVEAGPT